MDKHDRDSDSDGILRDRSSDRDDANNWIFPAIGFAATIQVATHSSIDFSLQIPAIAMTYAAILGIATAQSFSSRNRNS